MLFSTSGRKGGLCFFLFAILSALLVFSSQSSSALAAPAPVSELGELYDRAEKNIPDKEEVEKLIKPENLNDFKTYAKKDAPAKDKAIYFTGQPAKEINKIVEWAKKEDLTSVRNIWKNANFFQKGQYKEVSDEDFKKFQQAFSKYYAQQTDGKAYLVFPHDKKPSKTGIFWSVELDELIKHEKVEEIVWIDQNKIGDKDYKPKEEKTVYWKKGEKKPEGA